MSPLFFRLLQSGCLALVVNFTAIFCAYGEDVFVRLTSPQNEQKYDIYLNDKKLPQRPEGVAVEAVNAGKYQLRIVAGSAEIGLFPFRLKKYENAEIFLSFTDGRLMANIETFSSQDPPGSSQDPPGQNTGYLIGIVKSAFDDIPLSDAEVKVGATQEQVLTDADGRFKLAVPRGVHSLQVTHAEHKARTADGIAVFTGESSLIDLVLPKIGYQKKVDEIVVFGVMTGLPTAAAEIERQSNTVMDVLNADDLSRSGDASAAGAIQRITGVAVVDDKFAVVRGLAGRYIASTLDGGLLPSTDFLRRDVPLDIFPANILGGINIEKSYRPELPGDTTGGLIGMQARGVPDEKVNKVSLSLGMNTEVYDKDILTYKGGSRDWVGMDDGTRELPGRIDALTDYGRQPLPDACLPPPLTQPGCMSTEEYAQLGTLFPNHYATTEQSGEPTWGLGYAYGNRFEMAGGDLGFYAAVDYSQKWQARNNAEKNSWILEGDAAFTINEEAQYQRSNHKVDLSTYLAVGYEGDSGLVLQSKTLLLRKTSDVTRFTARRDVTENKLFEETVLQWAEQEVLAEKLSAEWVFGEADAHALNGHLGYATSSRYEPDKREYTYENGLLTPSRIFRKYSELNEDSIDFGLDYIWDAQWTAAIAPTLKAGLYSVRKDRDLQSARYGFNVNNSVDRSQAIEAVLSAENFNADLVRLRSQGQATDYFDAQDDVDAVYLSTETDLGESISLLLGARYEHASQAIEYPLGDSADSIEPLTSNEVLPALMLTWRATDKWQLRAGYSQTLSRPGLVERSNTQFFDPDTDEKIIGNPNLTLSQIDNLDLRAEYYFSDEENITLALFIKNINDPIEKTVPAGVRDGYTFRNTDKADLTGLELDFKKILLDDGKWYVFVAGNAALIDSEVSLDEETARLEGIQDRPRYSRSLQGQSEYLANLQLGVDNFEDGHSITLMVNHFGDRINRVDNVSRGDEMEVGRTLLDLIYRCEMMNGLTIKAKISNLLDEETVFESRGERQKTVESYHDGIGISLGVAADF